MNDCSFRCSSATKVKRIFDSWPPLDADFVTRKALIGACRAKASPRKAPNFILMFTQQLCDSVLRVEHLWARAAFPPSAVRDHLTIIFNAINNHRYARLCLFADCQHPPDAYSPYSGGWVVCVRVNK